MKLVSLKPAKPKKGNEKDKARGIGTVGGESPPSIHFSHEHLKKLGIKKLPQVGDKLHIQAIAHVASVGAHEDESGPNQHMHVELHHVGYKHHDESSQDKAANAHKGAKAAMDDALGDLATDDETE